MGSNDDILDRLNRSRQTMYVGFVDILGFGDRVLEDPIKASQSYVAILRASAELRARFPKNMPQYVAPRIEFWSDSAVVVSADLRAVVEGCQDLQTGALLSAHALVRGCIARGGHAQCRSGDNTLVVSDALVRAVRGEKTAHYPRIVLDRETGVAQEAQGLVSGGFSGALWSEDGHVMVQPFVPDFSKTTASDPSGISWYEPILDSLVEEHAASPHWPKYEWLRSQLRRVEEHMDELRSLDPYWDDDV